TTIYNHRLILGDEALVAEFRREIDRFLDTEQRMRTELAKETILKDLEKYYLRLGSWIAQSNTYSLKYDFYRPFMNILDVLAMQGGIHAQSPWHLIESLKIKRVINEKLKDVLINYLN